MDPHVHSYSQLLFGLSVQNHTSVFHYRRIFYSWFLSYKVGVFIYGNLGYRRKVSGKELAKCTRENRIQKRQAEERETKVEATILYNLSKNVQVPTLSHFMRMMLARFCNAVPWTL